MRFPRSRLLGRALLILSLLVPAGIVLAGSNKLHAPPRQGEHVGAGGRAAPAPCVSGKLQYLTKSDGQIFLGKMTDKPDEFLTCNCETKKVASDDKLTDADEKCVVKTDPTNIPPEPESVAPSPK